MVIFMDNGTKKYTRWTLSSFVAYANEVHDSYYDYSLVKTWGKIGDKISIICPSHGHFVQRAMSHVNGRQCTLCANRLKGDAKIMSFEEFVSRANSIHGQYQYTKNDYTRASHKLTITCNIHGEFSQTGTLHLQGQGCPICGRERNAIKRTTPFEVVIDEAKRLNPEYDYSEAVVGKNNKATIKIICSLHGAFYQSPNNHVSKQQKCPSCRGKISRAETIFFDSLRLPPSTIYNTRSIIAPYELDAYIPDKNIAIEYCGIYWHSKQPKLYHRQKMELCRQQGIKLYTVFDSDCYKNNEVVISSLAHKLGTTPTNVYARKCRIVEVNNKLASEFCKANHIQGHAACSIRLGLVYEDELLALLTISKSRFTKKYEYEIIRYCTKINNSITGGFSKLLTDFVRNYNPSSIISYADLRYGSGELYRKAGFIHSHDSPPNYWYFKQGSVKLESRVKYQKHKLVEAGADASMTEWQIMQQQGYNRIWDCGNAVWIYQPLDSNTA
jgi:hypothetical protein